ncbi:MAG TPA: hypothetical protein VMX33_13600, partial [bacterium]|nr:hypothetical protein [bacterium]
ILNTFNQSSVSQIRFFRFRLYCMISNYFFLMQDIVITENQYSIRIMACATDGARVCFGVAARAKRDRRTYA